MTKASLKLPNGTEVQIEGSPEEVHQLLSFYAGDAAKPKPKSSKKPEQEAEKVVSDELDLSDVVNLVKECDEAEKIESQILDRSSQVDRTLLPMYIVHEYLDNNFGLTSGEISKITGDLGIPLSQPNASTTLSGTASRYVKGDKVKKKGQVVRYKLIRRGVQYMKGVIEGDSGK